MSIHGVWVWCADHLFMMSAFCSEHTGSADCGPYWCEARADSSVVISQAARVDFQQEEKVPPNTSWERKEG